MHKTLGSDILSYTGTLRNDKDMVMIMIIQITTRMPSWDIIVVIVLLPILISFILLLTVFISVSDC